jgi:hypothetical protein
VVSCYSLWSVLYDLHDSGVRKCLLRGACALHCAPWLYHSSQHSSKLVLRVLVTSKKLRLQFVQGVTLKCYVRKAVASFIMDKPEQLYPLPVYPA